MATKIISFEKSSWGHALHSFTWKRLEPRSLLERIADWWHGTRRFSVLVHSCQRPEVGDLIRYPASEATATARVYAVEPMFDPQDMFKVFLLRDRAIDLQFNHSTNSDGRSP